MTGGAVVPEAVVEEWQKQMTVSLRRSTGSGLMFASRVHVVSGP